MERCSPNGCFLRARVPTGALHPFGGGDVKRCSMGEELEWPWQPGTWCIAKNTIHLDSGAINHSRKVLAKLSFGNPLGEPHA